MHFNAKLSVFFKAQSEKPTDGIRGRMKLLIMVALSTVTALKQQRHAGCMVQGGVLDALTWMLRFKQRGVCVCVCECVCVCKWHCFF